MEISNKDLKRRIIEISYKNKLSHLGSCLTAVDIIDEIYKKKGDSPFILSSGHAGLALYVVIEKYEGINAEVIFNHHGVHPDRCAKCHITCSTGSLGQGLPIAVGMALANRKRPIYCLTTDGEWAEGSMWEALHIKQKEKLDNLKIYLNFNNFSAYGMTDIDLMPGDMFIHYRYTFFDDFPFLKELDAHYHIMTEDDYKLAMEILK